MKFWWAIVLSALVTGCASTGTELRYVDTGAPMWNLNPGMWNASSNAITTAPTQSINVGPQR